MAELLETRDKRLLRTLFLRDPAATMYMLADLRSPMFERCRWFAAVVDGEAQAAILLFQALEVPTVLCCGEACALVERFAAELPPRFHTKLSAANRGAFARHFTLEPDAEIDMMALSILPPPEKPPPAALRLLSTPDLPDMLRLYADYPGNWFHPSQLARGLYAGAFLDDRLAAIAGTHAFAPQERIAVLGEIVTARDFRNHGLCRYVVSYLVRHLRETGCGDIGLHVASDNAPAIACYERIGFTKRGRLTQMWAHRAG